MFYRDFGNKDNNHIQSSIRERIQSILIQDEISEDFPTQLFCVEKEIENDEARSCHEKC